MKQVTEMPCIGPVAKRTKLCLVLKSEERKACIMPTPSTSHETYPHNTDIMILCQSPSPDGGRKKKRRKSCRSHKSNSLPSAYDPFTLNTELLLIAAATVKQRWYNL